MADSDEQFVEVQEVEIEAIPIQIRDEQDSDDDADGKLTSLYYLGLLPFCDLNFLSTSALCVYEMHAKCHLFAFYRDGALRDLITISNDSNRHAEPSFCPSAAESATGAY